MHCIFSQEKQTLNFSIQVLKIILRFNLIDFLICLCVLKVCACRAYFRHQILVPKLVVTWKGKRMILVFEKPAHASHVKSALIIRKTCNLRNCSDFLDFVSTYITQFFSQSLYLIKWSSKGCRSPSDRNRETRDTQQHS